VTTPRFAFRFVSTRRDILDGLGASLTARTGMRRWIRFAVTALGVAWLAGVVAVLFTDARPQAWWQPVLWAVLGGGIVWSFALHPWRMRRHILATTPATQPQVLEFSDTGIEIDAEGVGRVLMTFDDGSVHWLPARAFRSRTERRAFVNYATGMIPVDPHA
jgi:hypothetical protein